jgi:hypothetical protein
MKPPRVLSSAEIVVAKVWRRSWGPCVGQPATERRASGSGRGGLHFVSTANAARVEAQCPTTAILPGGQITTQGTIVNRSLNFTLPITGGFGRYQGAGGQVVSRDMSTPTQPQVELTFHLEF